MQEFLVGYETWKVSSLKAMIICHKTITTSLQGRISCAKYPVGSFRYLKRENPRAVNLQLARLRINSEDFRKGQVRFRRASIGHDGLGHWHPILLHNSGGAQMLETRQKTASAQAYRKMLSRGIHDRDMHFAELKIAVTSG